MYINFGSINSRQAADGSCTAPLTVDSCGTCRLKKHASLPTITRYDENAYQLFYIAAGKAHFWFDDAEHVVTAGHMVLYRPQEERRYIYYLEDHPEVFWLTGYKYKYYKDSPNLIFIPEYLFDKNKIREHQKAMEARVEKLVRPARKLSQWEKDAYQELLEVSL